MGFVIEKIDTVERKAELARIGLQSPFTSGPALVRSWLVDRSRGLYFINLGGGNIDVPFFLVLADASGVLLRAEGHRQAKGPVVPGGVDESWRLEPIAMPAALEARAPQILAWLDEALHAYGSLGDALIARSVTVNMSVPRFV